MKKKNKHRETRKFHIFDKRYLSSVNAGSRWWHAEKHTMRISAKVVLSAFGTLGFSSAADIAAAAKLPAVGGAPVALATALWMARASLSSTGLCPDPTAAASKACDN